MVVAIVSNNSRRDAVVEEDAERRIVEAIVPDDRRAVTMIQVYPAVESAVAVLITGVSADERICGVLHVDSGAQYRRVAVDVAVDDLDSFGIVVVSALYKDASFPADNLQVLEPDVVDSRAVDTEDVITRAVPVEEGAGGVGAAAQDHAADGRADVLLIESHGRGQVVCARVYPYHIVGFKVVFSQQPGDRSHGLGRIQAVVAVISDSVGVYIAHRAGIVDVVIGRKDRSKVGA